MQSFEANIRNIYGARGQKWLKELPRLSERIALEYGLSDLRAISNLTYNYVLLGKQGDRAIALKLGLDYDALAQESAALECFKDLGCVEVLSRGEGFLLLNQAIPGTSLKLLFPDKDDYALGITCSLIKGLHSAKIPAHHNFPRLRDWLMILDQNLDIPEKYLSKAKIVRQKLLDRGAQEVLLHGDLHHDNILMNNGNWCVIDPKGIIGDPIFEVASFIQNPILLDQKDPSQFIQKGVAAFAENLKVSATTITEWCFVKSVLSWAWSLSDCTDDFHFRELTRVLNRII